MTSWIPGLTAFTVLLLAWLRYGDRIRDRSWRPPVLQPATGKHTARALAVALEEILDGRRPLAIEAPKGVMPHEPENRPSVGHKNLPGPDPLGALRPDNGVLRETSGSLRAGEPTDDDRYYARQAHGYIQALDPDHIGLPDDATIRMRPIDQYAALAWQQAGDNERQRNWQARHAFALPAGATA